MDPYERLTAINESLIGKIKGFFKRKPKEVKQFEKAVAALDQKYSDLPENQPTNESTEAERIDQAGARGKEALKNAGIKFKFRGGIGSMNREDNHYIVSSNNVDAAKKALKDIPNAQVKTK